ncbi:MAG: hypothetical protein ACR2IF_07155 [Terriglobales bacterium]
MKNDDSDREISNLAHAFKSTNVSLGEPINIRQVAQLIGCSAWSVRQRHIPQGLPYFRSSPSGRLIFYRDQVVRWILENQIQERRT